MKQIYLYNTLTRKKEGFKAICDMKVKLYACGLTVYSEAHIGNLRAYIFDDLLRRVLESDGYEVKHAMNVTDVGHLVGDGDEGEDKLELGARREKTDPLALARKYEEKFFEDLRNLNVELPHKVVRATEAIKEQIELIKLLEEKGYTYKDEFAIYFDTSKLLDYGKLTGQKLEEKKVGAREEVVVDSGKKNPQDFALWFFLAGKYEDHILHWPSPWGEGFPGWHIECSAISRATLGQPFDIHLGGVDHIGTHHTNEIAQSEAAYGLPLAHFWLHNEYLMVDGQKMSKSLGNVYTLADLKKKGFDPVDFRYFILGGHYRSKLNFTWQALEGARATLRKIRALEDIPSALENSGKEDIKAKVRAALFDDLDTPRALAILHEANDFSLWKDFENVLALDIEAVETREIPSEVRDLAKRREEARGKKDWQSADQIRGEIEKLGYGVEDTGEGIKLRRK
ncbi:MAG: cysteine--tRNA ligase [bacterium]|nr:cysteine--tRNA ligase [bacterium]